MIGGANWNSNALSFYGVRLMFDEETFNIHFLGYKIIGTQPGQNGLLSANAPTNYTDPATGKTLVVNPGLPNQYLTVNLFTGQNNSELSLWLIFYMIKQKLRTQVLNQWCG